MGGSLEEFRSDKIKHDDRRRDDEKHQIVRGQIFRNGEEQYSWSVQQAAKVKLLNLVQFKHVNDGVGGGGGDGDGSSKDWREVEFPEKSSQVEQEPAEQHCQADQHEDCEEEDGDGDEGSGGGEEEQEAGLPLPAHGDEGGVRPGGWDGGRWRHRGAGRLRQPSPQGRPHLGRERDFACREASGRGGRFDHHL